MRLRHFQLELGPDAFAVGTSTRQDPVCRAHLPERIGLQPRARGLNAR